MSSVLEPATARPPATTAAEPAAEPEVKWDGLFPASLRAVMLNYCCAAALLLLGFQFYTTVPGLLEPAWAGVDDPVGRVFALLGSYRRALVETDCTYG